MQLLATSAMAALLMGGQAVGELCKCSPTDACWPSDAEWEAFNATITGNLIRTVPPGSVCYPDEPNYDSEACDAVISGWSSSVFHSSDPASVSTAWSNSSCVPVYPNGTSVDGVPGAGDRGCSLGALPSYVVNVTGPEEVQGALRFAREKNLRVVIKNTGHNGSGSTPYRLTTLRMVVGSLTRPGSIWTHNLKQTQFHERFQPVSCSANTTWKGSQMAITIGAGIQDGEIFDFAKKNNVVAVGGTSKDVGVVGWATGGGHGFMTGEYGMGADNILEAVIVTPSGDLITANACQNEDVFWAIRGGGGGTFGVIVNMTMKAYPVPEMTLLGLNAAANNGTSSKAWWRFVAQLHGLLPAIQEEGVKGYYTIGAPAGQTIALASSLFLWNAANGTAERVLAPVKALLAANNGTVTGSVQTIPVPSFYDLLETMPITESGARATTITAARLITRRVVTEEQGLLAEVLEEVGTRVLAPTNGLPNLSMSGTMTIGHEPVDNALNPAWRDSVVHLITQQSWDGSLPAANVSRIVNDMTYNKLNALRRLDPGSGTYLNEANTFEPGWQWSFFGPNYGRLRSIKDKYDPEGLLWCPQCVGGEDWVQREDGRLCEAYKPFGAR
ncbi:FAD binding domain protein [Colletotrichum higginsianum IMI 349063]|uniref:FAD binding domain protein n=1 Tax=Colletotrichum higginsianum (strain IMI 349063) TaxID=759273 RepID=A0A1B7Y1C3_COLHI|nr:FAD binding domain protein [Colletotrichum higginsianum IMI 349063]OBR05809.1 FAD binding domain protein [Colletotrichum higginsianum IMI 349063]